MDRRVAVCATATITVPLVMFTAMWRFGADRDPNIVRMIGSRVGGAPGSIGRRGGPTDASGQNLYECRSWTFGVWKSRWIFRRSAGERLRRRPEEPRWTNAPCR